MMLSVAQAPASGSPLPECKRQTQELHQTATSKAPRTGSRPQTPGSGHSSSDQHAQVSRTRLYAAHLEAVKEVCRHTASLSTRLPCAHRQPNRDAMQDDLVRDSSSSFRADVRTEAHRPGRRRCVRDGGAPAADARSGGRRNDRAGMPPHSTQNLLPCTICARSPRMALFEMYLVQQSIRIGYGMCRWNEVTCS